MGFKWWEYVTTTDTQTLKLEKGDILDVEIVSDSGKLSMLLKNDQDGDIYKGNDVLYIRFS